MYSRIGQVARHLTRPRPNFVHQSAAAIRPPALAMANASLSADQRNKKTVHTAGCIIIGDEVLGGKTVDTNSAYMAKFCFKTGINLKRIEVIGDDEGEIMQTVRKMSDNYDFVVTSGGIGPTYVCNILLPHLARFFKHIRNPPCWAVRIGSCGVVLTCDCLAKKA